MSQENNNNGLSEAQNERILITHEASIHLYEATKNILEKGFDEQNKQALCNALAYNIVASNLLYTNKDVDVEAMLPVVQNVQAVLSKLLKFQPSPIVEEKRDLPAEETKQE